MSQRSVRKTKPPLTSVYIEQEEQGSESLDGEPGNQIVASAVLGTGVVGQVSAGGIRGMLCTSVW